MKRAIKALLAALGLAPASQVERLNGEVRRAEAKFAQLERDIELVRADAQSWKRRFEDSSETVAGWKQATQRAQAETGYAKEDVERIKVELDRVRAELERERPITAEWKRRAEALKLDLQEMRARLDNAHRVGDLATEQLMAMEVKLDLIEAAIQVLDLRTREHAVSSPV